MKFVGLALALCLSPFVAFAADTPPPLTAEQIAAQANGELQEFATQRGAALDRSVGLAGQVSLDAAQIKDLQSQLDKANADLKAANDKAVDLQKQIDAAKVP